jgi:hypothetical protein
MIWLKRELPDGGTLYFVHASGRVSYFTVEKCPGRRADVIRTMHFAIPPVQRAVARGEDVTAMLAAMNVKMPGQRRKKGAQRASGG